MSPEAVELCELIDRAFGPMSYPGDDDIVDGCDWESEEIKEALKGRHWRDVSFDALDKIGEALNFLSPVGFRFYLPAFMMMAVVDYDRADLIPGSIMGKLTAPQISDVEERQAALERFTEIDREHAILSLDQVRSIKAQMGEYYRTGESQRWFDERVSGFTPEQSKVIRKYLEHMRDFHGDDFDEEAQRALDRYWRRF